jgi:hypothetical protein
MALHMRAKITQADGQRTALDVICPSRTHLDQIVANACPDHRGYQTAIKRGRLDLPLHPAAPAPMGARSETAIKRGRLDLPLHPAAPAPMGARSETAMPDGTPESKHPHISLLDMHRPAVPVQPATVDKPSYTRTPQQAELDATVDKPSYTRTPQQAELDAYERGLMDGREGSAGACFSSALIGAVIALVLLSAFPQAAAFLLPTVAAQGR